MKKRWYIKVGDMEIPVPKDWSLKEVIPEELYYRGIKKLEKEKNNGEQKDSGL